jgi:hypothetical protein
MAHNVYQEGSQPMPQGTIRLGRITEQCSLVFEDIDIRDVPPFLAVIFAGCPETVPLPYELMQLLLSIKQERGIQHCWLKQLCCEGGRVDTEGTVYLHDRYALTNVSGG